MYRGVRMFVVLHCMLERACVVHRWIWLRRPFDVSPCADRVLVYVRRRLPLYVGYEVVYPTGWRFYFLIVEDLRPPHQIQVAAFALDSFLCGDCRHICLRCCVLCSI